MESESFIVRVTAFQEQQTELQRKSLSSGHVGDYLIPCSDPSVNLYFDLDKPVTGRIFMFEILGPRRSSMIGESDSRTMPGSGREYQDVYNLMRAMAGSIRLYRYLIVQ